ncbi:hypothetical protein BGZ73_007941 [Actinomortierella ambigua]|nr:hypothetical protein BGZ73_007941 [Actinomortierella ambigua]
MTAILRAAHVVRSANVQGLARRAYSKSTRPQIEPDEVKFPKFSSLSKSTKILLTGGLVIAAAGEGVFWYKYFKGESKPEANAE